MADVDTESGEVSGLEFGRRARLQGHSLRRLDRRRQPLHAAAQARALDRRARSDRLCRPLAAGRRGGATARARDGLGRRSTRCRSSEDCLTLQRLDARPRQRQAAGDGVAARRRLLLRLGQLAALRQHATGRAQRRGGGRGQPSPEHLRPSRPVGLRRALRHVRQRRRARPGRRAGMGARQHARASAAIPATSRSSASRAAAER